MLLERRRLIAAAQGSYVRDRVVGGFELVQADVDDALVQSVRLRNEPLATWSTHLRSDRVRAVCWHGFTSRSPKVSGSQEKGGGGGGGMMAGDGVTRVAMIAARRASRHGGACSGAHAVTWR